jgi:hypothetical protein
MQETYPLPFFSIITFNLDQWQQRGRTKKNIFFVSHSKPMCVHTTTATKDYKPSSYEPTFHSFIHFLPFSSIYMCMFVRKKVANDLHMLLLSSTFRGLCTYVILYERVTSVVNELLFIFIV